MVIVLKIDLIVKVLKLKSFPDEVDVVNLRLVVVNCNFFVFDTLAFVNS